MDIIMQEDSNETGDYVANEKEKTVNLTQQGVEKVERFFHLENLADPENLEIQHCVNLSLRAHALMHRDKDYVVKDDEVLIVDEFTGRIMPGRRYSDGLHQAIEAKEHVKVKRESKTLATITFQNFFNKYKKKSGMTGTALTEEKEFREIYGMDVVEVPTNLPVQRIDHEDSVYKTKREKYNAIVKEIQAAHEKGQPVLVGTITIDSSDDSLHCGGDMQLLGGSMTLATADDGAHSDHALTIGSTGGDYDAPYVNITKSYEGIEGVDITQNSGTVMVTSSDDGYNAAGGADSSGNNNSGGWGQGSWGGPGGGSSSDGSQTMTFNGGYAYVNAAGDGLDSNGNIYFNGGYVFVSQTGGGNGPLDCGDSNNSITYSGGTVIAAGSSDMFETPSSYSFLSTTSVSAGQTITFTDASGNVLATFTLPNGSAEMVMCSQESSVTCYTGGTLSGTTYFASQDSTNRCGYGGTISGGTAVSASSGGNSGPGGGGNNRPF